MLYNVHHKIKNCSDQFLEENVLFDQEKYLHANSPSNSRGRTSLRSLEHVLKKIETFYLPFVNLGVSSS